MFYVNIFIESRMALFLLDLSPFSTEGFSSIDLMRAKHLDATIRSAIKNPRHAYLVFE